MATDVHGHTAKVLQFPLRKQVAGDHVTRRAEQRSNLVSMQIATMAFDNCWYHDEALREAARDQRKS